MMKSSQLLFITKILTIEPDKIQLWYCLGLIYYFAHHDYILAKESFNKFKMESLEKNN